MKLLLAIAFLCALAGRCEAAAQKPVPSVPSLVDAIGKAENSRRYPYGIVAKRKLTEAEARRWCENTVRRRLAEWQRAGRPGHPVDWIARTYAPIGASNDPRGLNRNWASNVKRLYKP